MKTTEGSIPMAARIACLLFAGAGALAASSAAAQIVIIGSDAPESTKTMLRPRPLRQVHRHRHPGLQP